MKVSDEAWCLYEKTNVFLMERSIPIRFRDCPSKEPKIDLAQARKLARRCFRKFSKRPLSFYVNKIEAISGSTHTWTNNKKGNGKTLLVNVHKDWGEFIHDLSHLIQVKNQSRYRRGKAWHCAEHAALEYRIAKTVLEDCP